MSEQLTPFVSPDSVRKTFQLLNRFYDGYTKKNVGYTDIKGLKYAGTSENFGSEIYFEARKMRMKRPPIDMVFFHNDFGFYFNIMYSELIETYDQQTMIVATLKGESLLSNKRYDIIFSNCNEETVLRAESWGDPEVKRDSFITTETAPILRITNADNTHTDVSLVATCGRILKYCFHRNLTNARMYTYDETNHILTVENITKRQNNIPLIWILSTDFNTLPDIGFFNNIDKNGKPLLTVGTDGQSVSRLYPYVYEDNYPAAFDPDDGLHWFLKLKPTDETSFVGSGLSADEEVIIQYFEYIRAENPWSEPTITHIVTYSTSYTNIHLNNGSEWQYHTPQEGDYDYDGTTFVNRMYAYKNIDTLPDMHPLFKVKFNANFLNTFEAELIDETSGLHIGTCSDYSDNGILKKNGTIHNLGDFDGLPRYFKSFEDKTQHRSHVEMYAIRDEINSSRQRAKDKQTAAILIDSGLPKKDVEDYYNDMKVLIKYNMETDGEFYTEEEAMDMKDVMSSLVYVDDHNFGEEHLPGYFSLPHFIYHGKGVFSLTMSELDPELEYGRVYIISNDSTTYENNNLTENPKPDRTFARICDIPTIFSQLIHITGYAPTILIDKKYIHSNASYNETDKDRLVNGMQSRWVTCYHDIDGEEKQYSNMGFFLSRNNMDLMIGKNTREFKSYTRKVNLNPSISYSDCTVSVADAGYDFNVDDTFTFYVGGILVTGTVTETDLTRVLSFTLDIDENQLINAANLDGRITTFDTSPKTGVGQGLTLTFEVSQSAWDATNMHTSNEPLDGLFSFKFDKYGFLWVWEYDPVVETWKQKSRFFGPDIVENSYDTSEINKRETSDAMLYNLISRHRLGYKQNVFEYMEDSVIETTVGLDTITTFDRPDYPSTYYVLDNYPAEYHIYDKYRLTYYTDAKVTDTKSQLIFPRYNEINLWKYGNKGVSLEYMNTDAQPIMGFYNPVKDTVTTYERVSSTTYDITEKGKTILDVINPDFITPSGFLKAPVFVYNEFTMPNQLKDYINRLSMMSRDALITLVRTEYPHAILLQYEDTANAYSSERIIDYLISNYYENPPYKKNDIIRFKQKEEQVVRYNGTEVIPVGEQPTGGDEYLVERHSTSVTMDGAPQTANIVNIFRLDESIDLSGFRIIDDIGNDVSEMSLIIMNRDFYVFIDNAWRKIG